MEESTAKLERSIAAPMIFIIVVALQFLSRYFEINKKKGSTSSEDMQLRAEIKQLLKEASALLQPSTFAQAAKLRRLATAKERELAINQEIRSKEAKLSYDTQKALLFCRYELGMYSDIYKLRLSCKMLIYPNHTGLDVLLVDYVVLAYSCGFHIQAARTALWEILVHISIELSACDLLICCSSTSAGKMLSWRAGGPANENVMVGIIPWLLLSTRVSKSISRRIFKWDWKVKAT
ncbi:hypothetical protein RND71_012004 [Anisodus tanguticus]|uniref:Uncharacterized protein n=1 Tax=Anisodus tanguticus TaxID=243964 RepID=A0AAE1VGK2_9SOLA|nr:hypothetical protein RND71_012004 [Anisodus tanguticus]